MVFGIFKFIKEAIQEGIEEGKAELAAEKSQKLAQAQQLTEKYAQLDKEEIFLTALAAPYRETFISDLSESAEQNRPAYWLSAMDVPEEKKSELAKYLERDFGVSDALTLRHKTAWLKTMAFLLLLSDHGHFSEQDAARLASMTDSGGAHSSNEALEAEAEKLAALFQQSNSPSLGEDKLATLVLWLSRLAYMHTVGVGLGYSSKEQATAQMRSLAALSRPLVKDWKQFGELFVLGDKLDGSNNMVGRKVLSRQVTLLLENTQSPWLKYQWKESAM